MDANYQPLYKEAAKMQHQFHDYTLDMAHNPSAMIMRREIHNLTDDLATNKHPRTIENRLRLIEQQLRRSEIDNPGLQGAESVMQYNHSSAMLDHLEQMRQGVRHLPHY